MQIFNNPQIVIICFALGVVCLGALAVVFALRGLKTAKGHTEQDFVPIGKMESSFKKLQKLNKVGSVLYIGVDSENLTKIFSKLDVFSEIKLIVLQNFSNLNHGLISISDNKNFVVYANANADDLQNYAKQCLSEIDNCLLKHGVLKIVNIRIGAYCSIASEVSFDEVISRAKQAYMHAKNQNIPYFEWTISSGKALEKKIKIENNIEKEIDNNRFFLEYQPVLDAKTHKIIGAEVLSRLNSETDGVLTPGSFLSAVDSVGLNEKFDYYIFEKNCKWISNDKKQREALKYTINFSRSTLSEPAFAEKIIGIAEKYDLKLSCLAVEVLEDKNISGESKQQMIENLSTLKDKGVSILLDDFGSGYTTFGDLQNLDISIVKIDKEITQNAVTETGFIILKNIIRTSQDIGFKTLCEGIETEEQEQAAIKAGCDLLQGFYYYKPMPVTMLEGLFNNREEGV